MGRHVNCLLNCMRDVLFVWFELRRSIELDVSVTCELLFNYLFILF